MHHGLYSVSYFYNVSTIIIPILQTLCSLIRISICQSMVSWWWYREYVQNVIVERTVPIHQSIKRNSLPLLKQPQSTTNKAKEQVVSLKSDCNLFSRLYIASKFRDEGLEDFFRHENQPWPPSISEHGRLRLPTKKSDLLALLDVEDKLKPPERFNVKVFDGAAIVHSLPTKHVSTFDAYSDEVIILLCILNYFQTKCDLTIITAFFRKEAYVVEFGILHLSSLFTLCRSSYLGPGES